MRFRSHLYLKDIPRQDLCLGGTISRRNVYFGKVVLAQRFKQQGGGVRVYQKQPARSLGNGDVRGQPVGGLSENGNTHLKHQAENTTSWTQARWQPVGQDFGAFFSRSLIC
jgi:hypothetical protein